MTVSIRLVQACSGEFFGQSWVCLGPNLAWSDQVGGGFDHISAGHDQTRRVSNNFGPMLTKFRDASAKLAPSRPNLSHFDQVCGAVSTNFGASVPPHFRAASTKLGAVLT